MKMTGKICLKRCEMSQDIRTFLKVCIMFLLDIALFFHSVQKEIGNIGLTNCMTTQWTVEVIFVMIPIAFIDTYKTLLVEIVSAL